MEEKKEVIEKNKSLKENKAQESKIDVSLFVSEGMNLIPPKPKEEIESEQKKGTFNIGGALAALFLVLLSLIIIGYNILLKTTLNNKKSTLYSLESQVKSYQKTVRINDALKVKIEIFNDILAETVPFEEIIDYWVESTKDLVVIEKIEITKELNFKFSGRTEEILNAAKFWHLLSIDPRIKEANLDKFSKEEGYYNFEFSGSLNSEYFIKNK